MWFALVALVGLHTSGCNTKERNSVSSTESTEELFDYTWSGIGFGIDMSAELYGVTRAEGDHIGAAIEQLIQELEQACSLYLEDSELRILNRERELHRPTQRFLEILQLAKHLNLRTKGYYQPAIHGAWSEMELRESDPARWQQYCEASTMSGVRFSNAKVELTSQLTQLSFNALVQGYLADQVKEVIEEAGVKSALLHLGETYAIGSHPEGRSWKLAVMGTGAGAEVDQVGVIEFSNAGLAVSAHDESRQLLNPKNWTVTQQDRVVAVVSIEGAAVADAFATALAVAPPEEWDALWMELSKEAGSQVKIWVSNQLAFER